MTQEEKDLLLKDICTRLPYGVICNTPKGNGHLCFINQTIFGTEYGVNIKATERDYFNDREVCIKPYLRPMSSMTEEECKELGDLPATIENVGETLPNIPYYIEVARSEQLDYFNAHHFDYRGLIDKGLALEAPEGLYK